MPVVALSSRLFNTDAQAFNHIFGLTLFQDKLLVVDERLRGVSIEVVPTGRQRRHLARCQNLLRLIHSS